MNCPQCGDDCHCSPELPPAAETDQLPESHAATRAEHESDEDDTWRNELSAKLNQYRARRKPTPPRYPSLRLKFDEPLPPARDSARTGPTFEPTSHQALALDDRASDSSPQQSATLSNAAPELSKPPEPATARQSYISGILSNAVKSAGKLIEFPRFTPPVPSPDELAEPVFDRPRILEVPDIEPPAPALGGITIEPLQRKEIEKRPGIDIPLLAAPLARRVLAASFDGLVITLASALFGFIFWKVTNIRPPRLQLFGLAAGIPGTLWAAYEYLMLVYSGTTPGLRIASLQLTRFDGTSTNRALRRWRVFAFYLSAISLCMGYLWVFLDEDALCWHDRITHTFLAPRTEPKDIA